ncbi:MAG: response regulator, partial [Peristeroidobacter soli]
ILCVDDDAATLECLRELLARWGFRVLAVGSPEAAIALHADHAIDIVLADYQMQNRPAGLELLERLVHRAPDGQKRAGALLTADATEKMVEEAGKLGFPVLRKPVRPAALRALISALVDRIARANQASSSGAGAAN